MIVNEKDIVVLNPHGIHSRVATKLAMIGRHEQVTLFLIHEERTVDCSSILDVLSMAIPYGSRLKVRIEGADDKVRDALLSVVEILEGKDEIE